MDRWRSGGTWLRRGLDGLLILLVGLCLLTLVLGRILPMTGRPTFVVAGGSMEPTMPIGSAVVVEPVDPGKLAVGDVVSLRSGEHGALFTHRIIRIAQRDGRIWLETKGDANAEPDPSLTPASAVIGREIFTLPLVGYLISLFSIPSGVVFVLSLGLVLLLAAWSLDDRRPSDVTNADDIDVELDLTRPMPAHPNRHG